MNQKKNNYVSLQLGLGVTKDIDGVTTRPSTGEDGRELVESVLRDLGKLATGRAESVSGKNGGTTSVGEDGQTVASRLGLLGKDL